MRRGAAGSDAGLSARRVAHVAHVTASYLPDGGGIARYVHALAAGRRAGRCTVLTPASHGLTRVEFSEGVRVVRVSKQWVVHSEPTGIVALGMLPRLRGLSGQGHGQGHGQGRLVHAHLPFPALLGFAPFARCGTPWVVTYHNEIQGSLGVPAAIRAVHDWLLRRLLARARAIVVTTADYASACPTLTPFRSKVRVVPYGIDAETFARRARGVAVERRGDVLLYVGRLAYYKGLDVLLKALVDVPGARLLIVGEGPEGKALRRLAAELGVGARLEWRGHVPDAELPGLYSSAAALVLPSTGLSESFGIVQLEAHACGTPVVCSDLPGVREVNPHGVTGLHARSGDVEDLSRALRLLLEDAELRARLGEQAASRVRDRFSVDRMLEGIEAVYAEL